MIDTDGILLDLIMTNQQKNIVVCSLVGLSAILAAIFLRIDWTSHYADAFRLFIWDEQYNMAAPGGRDEYGLLVRMSAIGIMLGIVAPFILSTASAFLYVGVPREQLRQGAASVSSTPQSTSHDVHLQNPSASGHMRHKEEVKGLRGWLILVAARLFVAPLFGTLLIILAAAMLAAPTWGASEANWISIDVMIIIEASAAMYLSIARPIWLLTLFFQKKDIFPEMYIKTEWMRVYYCVFALFGWIVTNIFRSGFDVSRSVYISFDALIATFVWTLAIRSYLRNSVRVKNTFVA